MSAVKFIADHKVGIITIHQGALGFSEGPAPEGKTLVRLPDLNLKLAVPLNVLAASPDTGGDCRFAPPDRVTCSNSASGVPVGTHGTVQSAQSIGEQCFYRVNFDGIGAFIVRDADLA